MIHRITLTNTTYVHLVVLKKSNIIVMIMIILLGSRRKVYENKKIKNITRRYRTESDNKRFKC